MLNRYDLIEEKSVLATASGNTELIAPSATKRLRLYYLAMNADPSNSAMVTSAIRFGDAGQLRYRLGLTAGSIFARAIGAGRKYVEGAIGEALNVNLSAAQSVNVVIEYEEVEA